MYPTNEFYTEEYMEFSKKYCIACMAAYKSVDYLYINNMTDITKKHQIGFIYNKTHVYNITVEACVRNILIVSKPTC